MARNVRCGTLLLSVLVVVWLWPKLNFSLAAEVSPTPETPPIELYEFQSTPGEPSEEVEPPATPLELEHLEGCRTNLRTMADALAAFRAAHDGKDPVWLSDLVPDYLPDGKNLLCPADEAIGDPLWEDAKDPNLPVSYMYEFAPARYDAARSNYRRFGDTAPFVRCWHHLDVPRTRMNPSGETVLTVDMGLRVFPSLPEWFADAEVLTNILERLREAVRSENGDALASYHFGLVALLPVAEQTELLTVLESKAQDPKQAQNGGLFKLLGALYRNQNRAAQSLVAYHRAATLLPDDAEPHFLLGTLYEQQGQVDDAIRSYESGLKSQPDTVDIILALSRLLVRAERVDDAKSWYGRLKEFFRPASRDYRYVTGEVAFLIGDYPAAAEHLEWIFAREKPLNVRDPFSRYLITRLSQIEAQLGNEAKSREYRVLLDPGEALVGIAAPNFSATTMDGSAVELSEYRGKVVLLFFWGSQSGRATALMPHLRNLHERYRGQDLVILGVNREQNAAAEASAIGGLAPYPVVYQAKDAFQAYKILIFPTLFFIDRKGIVRYRHTGFTDGQESIFEQRIRSLLQSDTPETGGQ